MMKTLLFALKLNLKSCLEYRQNFFVLCLFVIPVQITQLFFSWIIVEKFYLVIGWKKWEMYLLFSIFFFSYSISQVFFKQFRYIDKYILDGTMDIFFLRPCNLIYIYILYNISVTDLISQVFPATILLVLSIKHIDIIWNFKKIWLLFNTLINGIIIQACFFILIGSTAFWIIKNNALDRLYFSCKYYANYPLEVYGKEIRFLFTAIIPIGFLNYYPVSLILEKNVKWDFLGNYTHVVSLGLILLTYNMWRSATKRYISTGS